MPQPSTSKVNLKPKGRAATDVGFRMVWGNPLYIHLPVDLGSRTRKSQSKLGPSSQLCSCTNSRSGRKMRVVALPVSTAAGAAAAKATATATAATATAAELAAATRSPEGVVAVIVPILVPV